MLGKINSSSVVDYRFLYTLPIKENTVKSINQ